MSICYVCGCTITKSNTYREHIILNSIGGKIISSSIICKSCAPRFDVVDKVLSQQLNFVGLMLNIKRDRGTNPHIKATITETGEDIFISSGGKPVQIKPIIEKNQSDASISITARDKKQMREFIEGLKRKETFIDDTEVILNNAKIIEDYLDKPVCNQLQIGGKEFFRAICKMILSFYMHNGGNREQILHLIRYIKDGNQQDIVWYYYPNNVECSSKEPIQILHRLIVKANSTEKLMYGYVELFSTFKFLVLMSKNYIGEDFYKSYCFDVLSRTEIESSINLSLSKEEVIKIVEIKENKVDELKGALNKLMKFIHQKQIDDCITNMVKKNVDTCFQGLTEGSVISDEIIIKLIDNLSEESAKFMYSKSQSYNK